MTVSFFGDFLSPKIYKKWWYWLPHLHKYDYEANGYTEYIAMIWCWRIRVMIHGEGNENEKG